MNFELAPVILFVYNRPVHTSKTLEALSLNDLADKSILYVYCDGPKENASWETIQKIDEVRTIVKEKQWCKEIHIIESSKNKGLAASIKNGVTDIINHHGKAIVIEDDLVTSPAFLNYMNNALTFYETRKSVFSITGYNLPPSKMKIPDNYSYDVYVCLRNGAWGWGTWSDRWNQVDWDLKYFERINSNPFMINAFNRGGDDIFDMLKMQRNGRLNIWSIQFTLAHFVNHAVAIAPVISFVDNTGVDGSGENCSPNEGLRNNILNQNRSIRFLEVLYEDSRLINAFYSAFCRIKRPVWQKMINRLSRILGRKNVFYIKKKIYC